MGGRPRAGKRESTTIVNLSVARDIITVYSGDCGHVAHCSE